MEPWSIEIIIVLLLSLCPGHRTERPMLYRLRHPDTNILLSCDIYTRLFLPQQLKAALKESANKYDELLEHISNFQREEDKKQKGEIEDVINQELKATHALCLKVCYHIF